MKRYMIFIFSLLLVCALALAACGGNPATDGGTDGDNNSTTPQPLQFDGVTFADVTVTYDGAEHAITVSGALPEGTHVAYTNNKGTDAGQYTAQAVLTKDGYQTKTLSATLTVQKATLIGLTLSDKSFYCNGEPHSLQIEGNLPEGAQVSYTGNGQTTAGNHTVTATVTHKNYQTLTLTATMELYTLADVARRTVNALFDNKPDPWSFMPQGLQQSTMAYTSAPPTDFTDFVQVQTIGKRAIGKQLNVLYDALLDTSTLLGYADNVFAVGSSIADAYQTFINNNPNDYAQFSGQAAGFKIRITLNGAQSELLAGNSTVSMQLNYHAETGKRAGRIQITNGMALCYESSENALTFAVRTTVAGVGNVKKIDFLRTDNAVAGLMYEYTGTESKNLKTTAQIAFNDDVAVIVSDKREKDDLPIKGYEEVYNARTGEYLGGEVAEQVSIKGLTADYDTLWFMLSDVSGFTSVKATPEQNGANADTLYLNGNSDAMHTTLYGGLNKKAASRRYDVEMKDVWYVVKTTEDGKTKYEKIKTSVPMVFVQKEHTGTFGADMRDKNGNAFSADPVLPASNQARITAQFEAMAAIYAQAKNAVTFADITAYIGENNVFFTA